MEYEKIAAWHYSYCKNLRSYLIGKKEATFIVSKRYKGHGYIHSSKMMSIIFSLPCTGRIMSANISMWQVYGAICYEPIKFETMCETSRQKESVLDIKSLKPCAPTCVG